MTDPHKWTRRLPVRIYDYNCKLSESYYAPQTEFISGRSASREKEAPPESATFGERFASRPFYGSARGLPYEDSQSALKQSLVSRRAASESRARTRYNYQDDDIPDASSRQSRSRRRKMILNIENGKEPENVLPIPRRRPVVPVVDDDLDFHIKPLPKIDINEELRKIEEEFPRPRRSSVQFEEEFTSPPRRRRSLKHESISFSQPTSTTRSSARATFTSESSRVESSRPPLPPRSRNVSIGETDFRVKSPLRSSVADLLDNDFDFTPRSRPRLKSFGDIEEAAARPSAKMMRDSRRAQESEELSHKINNMVSRMRETALTAKAETVASQKYTRTLGSLSNDPSESLGRRKSRQQARINNFVYGIRY